MLILPPYNHWDRLHLEICDWKSFDFVTNELRESFERSILARRKVKFASNVAARVAAAELDVSMYFRSRNEALLRVDGIDPRNSIESIFDSMTDELRNGKKLGMAFSVEYLWPVFHPRSDDQNTSLRFSGTVYALVVSPNRVSRFLPDDLWYDEFFLLPIYLDFEKLKYPKRLRLLYNGHRRNAGSARASSEMRTLLNRQHEEKQEYLADLMESPDQSYKPYPEYHRSNLAARYYEERKMLRRLHDIQPEEPPTIGFEEAQAQQIYLIDKFETSDFEDDLYDPSDTESYEASSSEAPNSGGLRSIA